MSVEAIKIGLARAGHYYTILDESRLCVDISFANCAIDEARDAGRRECIKTFLPFVIDKRLKDGWRWIRRNPGEPETLIPPEGDKRLVWCAEWYEFTEDKLVPDYAFQCDPAPVTSGDCALASEEVLAKDWSSKEEGEAWNNLQKPVTSAEDAHDIAVAESRKDEPLISSDDMKKHLEDEGVMEKPVTCVKCKHSIVELNMLDTERFCMLEKVAVQSCGTCPDAERKG